MKKQMNSLINKNFFDKAKNQKKNLKILADKQLLKLLKVNSEKLK